MAAITKDARRVNKAQRQYDLGLDKFQDMIDMIGKDIDYIVDVLHGVAMGKSEDKYQVDKRQLAAMKDQFKLWHDNIQNPEKVLKKINDGLKKEFSGAKVIGNEDDSTPSVAIFSTVAR